MILAAGDRPAEGNARLAEARPIEEPSQMIQDRNATSQKLSIRLFSSLLLLFFAAVTAIAQSGTDALKNGFDNPPEGARPACGGIG